MFCTELAASCPHPLPPGPYLVLNNLLRTQQNQEQGQSKNFLTLLVRDDTGVFLCALEKARPGKVLCRFSLLSHLRAVGGTEGDIPLGSAGSCHVLTPWVEQRSSPPWRTKPMEGSLAAPLGEQNGLSATLQLLGNSVLGGQT